MFTYQVLACVVTVVVLFVAMRVVSIYHLNSIQFVDAFMNNLISSWNFKRDKRLTNLRILVLTWGRGQNDLEVQYKVSGLSFLFFMGMYRSFLLSTMLYPRRNRPITDIDGVVDAVLEEVRENLYLLLY